MKTMTCKQLGGGCDKKFSGETFDDIAALSRDHGMQMLASQDADHMEAIKEAVEIMQDPVKMENWINGKKAEFDALAED